MIYKRHQPLRLAHNWGSFEIYNGSADDLQAAPAVAVGPHRDTTDVVVEVPFHGAHGGTNVHIVAVVLVATVLVPKLHHAAPSGQTERRSLVPTATARPGHAVGALALAGRHPREDATPVVVVLVRGERASVLAAALGLELCVSLMGLLLGSPPPDTECGGLLRLLLGLGAACADDLVLPLLTLLGGLLRPQLRSLLLGGVLLGLGLGRLLLGGTLLLDPLGAVLHGTSLGVALVLLPGQLSTHLVFLLGGLGLGNLLLLAILLSLSFALLLLVSELLLLQRLGCLLGSEQLGELLCSASLALGFASLRDLRFRGTLVLGDDRGLECVHGALDVLLHGDTLAGLHLVATSLTLRKGVLATPELVTLAVLALLVRARALELFVVLGFDPSRELFA